MFSDNEEIVLSGSIIEYEDHTTDCKASLEAVVDDKLAQSEPYSPPIRGKKAELIKIDRS